MHTFSNKFDDERIYNHSWVRCENQAFMRNVKGIRNFILGTGAEVNYGISRGIWTFAHSRQCFKNFYKLYFGTAVTSKMFQGIFVHQL